MKGVLETPYGDKRISQELYTDIGLTGFSKSIEESFIKLRDKGYSSLVVRAAMLDEIGFKLAECSVKDGIKCRKAQQK